jgi:hypothetical protein
MWSAALGYPRTVSHIRPGDRLAVYGAEQVEGRVMRVDRDGLMVDWGRQLGAQRHDWLDVGARFVRLPRGQRSPGEHRRRSAS